MVQLMDKGITRFSTGQPIEMLHLFMKFPQKMHYNNGVIRKSAKAHENVGPFSRNSTDAGLTIYVIQYVLFWEFGIEEL